MDLSQTIHLLGDLLGQVISELESPAIFETEDAKIGVKSFLDEGPGKANFSGR